MAIDQLVGAPRRLIKFVSLVIALLMIGAIVTTVLYGQLLLTLAAAIVGGWAGLVFSETFKAELADLVRGQNQPDDASVDEPVDAPSAPDAAQRER